MKPSRASAALCERNAVSISVIGTEAKKGSDLPDGSSRPGLLICQGLLAALVVILSLCDVGRRNGLLVRIGKGLDQRLVGGIVLGLFLRPIIPIVNVCRVPALLDMRLDFSLCNDASLGIQCLDLLHHLGEARVNGLEFLQVGVVG